VERRKLSWLCPAARGDKDGVLLGARGSAQNGGQGQGKWQATGRHSPA
jgi:hypothetical protein